MLKTYNSGSTLLHSAKTTQPAAVSGLAVNTEGVFYGLIIKTDGSNNVVLNVYDNNAASGNRLLPSDLIIQGSVGLWTLGLTPGIDVETGIYVSVAVAGYGSCEYQVLYDDGE